MRSFDVHVQLQNSRDQVTQLPKELCKQRKRGYMYLFIFDYDRRVGPEIPLTPYLPMASPCIESQPRFAIIKTSS